MFRNAIFTCLLTLCVCYFIKRRTYNLSFSFAHCCSCILLLLPIKHMNTHAHWHYVSVLFRIMVLNLAHMVLKETFSVEIYVSKCFIIIYNVTNEYSANVHSISNFYMVIDINYVLCNHKFHHNFYLLRTYCFICQFSCEFYKASVCGLYLN